MQQTLFLPLKMGQVSAVVWSSRNGGATSNVSGHMHQARTALRMRRHGLEGIVDSRGRRVYTKKQDSPPFIQGLLQSLS